MHCVTTLQDLLPLDISVAEIPLDTRSDYANSCKNLTWEGARKGELKPSLAHVMFSSKEQVG